MHVKSISVYVRDQEQALRFYREVFGFEVLTDVPVGDDSDERWIEVKLPDDSIRLVLSTETAAEYFDESIGGWTNIIFAVDDVEAEVRRMEVAGAVVVEEPTRLDWGDWAVVADPDGNQFGISGPREGEDS